MAIRANQYGPSLQEQALRQFAVFQSQHADDGIMDSLLSRVSKRVSDFSLKILMPMQKKQNIDPVARGLGTTTNSIRATSYAYTAWLLFGEAYNAMCPDLRDMVLNILRGAPTSGKEYNWVNVFTADAK